MRLESLLQAALLFLIASAVPAAGPAQAQIHVAGTIVNGTAGSPAPSGVEVTIAQLSPTGDEVARAAAVSGPDGAFSAGPFDATKGERFIAAVQHLGVTYSTRADARAGGVEMQLTVFETTTDESTISVESDTLTIVGGSQGNIDALQVIRMKNAADRTFVGAGGGTSFVVKLPAAEGAMGITAQEGLDPERLVALPDGIGSQLPLHPGTTSFSYLYRIKSLRAGVSFSKPVAYPTEKAHLLAGPGLRIAADGFDFVESKPLGGRLYRRYSSVKTLPRNSAITVNVRPAQAADDLRTPVAISAAVIVGLALAVPLVRRRIRTKDSPSERERLIQRIAKLDDDHSAGRLDEQSYRQVRAELKAELLALSGKREDHAESKPD